MPDTSTTNARKAETQIAKYREEFQKLRLEFLDDGEIDKEEGQILKDIESMIAGVEAQIAAKTTGSGDGGTAEAEDAANTIDPVVPSGEEPVEPGAINAATALISGSVGKGGKNKAEDVQTVQQLLNQNGASPELETDGAVGPKTNSAISKFQQSKLGFQDGRVEPGGQTWSTLTGGGTVSGEQPVAGGEAGGGSGATTDGDAADPTGGGASDVPEIPEEEQRRISQKIEEQIPEEVAITIVDEGEELEPLASPEFPFLLNQEVSLGSPFGEIKVKFNDQGQIETAAVSKPIIPGATAGAGAYGVFATVSAKPYSGELKLSKPGGNLKLQLELSASGSGMMGLGYAKGDAWGGIGIDIAVKLARTETVTAEMTLAMLEQIAKSPSPLPGSQLAFDLPAKIVLSGQQSLVIGGSAPKGAASLATKFVLKDYNPMATLMVSEVNGKIECDFDVKEGLAEMAEDVSRQMIPMVDMVFLTIELAEEMERLIDDPDAYMEEKQKEAEELRRKLVALPGELSDFVDEELKKLEKFEDEATRQREEWEDDIEEAVEEAYDDAKEAVEEQLEDAGEALAEAGQAIEEVYDDASDAIGETVDDAQATLNEAKEALGEVYDEAEEAVDETIEDASELLDDAGEAIEAAYDDAKETVEEAGESLDEAYDEAKETVDETIDDAADALDEAGEAIEGAYDDAKETVDEKLEDAEEVLDDAYDEAKKAYDNPEEYAEEKADELLDSVSDWFSDDDDKAQT